MPIFAMRASIGKSPAAAGAMPPISFAMRLKYPSVPIARMTACGLSVMLKPGFGFTGGASGVYGLPHAESGVILYWVCSALTAL